MFVGNHDDDAIAYGALHNITYEAYSPLGPWGRPKPVLSDPVVQRIALAHNVSSAQVGMRWITQQVR